MSKFEVAPRETGEKAEAVKYKQTDFSLFIRPAGKEPSGQDCCPSKAAGVKMQICPNREQLNWECQARDFLRKITAYRMIPQVSWQGTQRPL